MTLGPPPGAYEPGVPPSYCTTIFPSKDWPPAAAPAVAAHLLTQADVPAPMTSVPITTYPVSGPDVDELAAGIPADPIAEAEFDPRGASSVFSSIHEILGLAPSQAAATSLFTFARDHVFGDCQYWWGDGIPKQIEIPESGPDIAAFPEYAGGSYESHAWVDVIGHRGDFYFDVSVANISDYPSTAQATLPTVGQVSRVVTAALAHLPY